MKKNKKIIELPLIIKLIKDCIRIFKILPLKSKILFWVFLLFMNILAIIETSILAVIALFAGALVNPKSVLDSKYLIILKSHFNIINNINEFEFLVLLSLIVVVLSFIKNILRSLFEYYQAKYSFFIGSYFGAKLLNLLLEMPYEKYLTKNSADLIIVINWCNKIGKYLLVIFRGLTDLIVIFFVFSSFIIVNPSITLLLMMILFSFAFTVYLFINKKATKIAINLRELTESVNRHVTKAIHGLKDIQVNNKEKFFVNDYKYDMKKLIKIRALRELIVNIPGWTIENFAMLVLCLIIVFLHFFQNKTYAEVTGTLALLGIGIWKIRPLIGNLFSYFTKVKLSIPFINKIFNFLDENKNNIQYKKNQNVRSIKFEDEIILKNIHFSYLSRKEKVLKSINIKIKKGSTIGIVGTSGAGKSTLVDILIGLLYPKEGSIIIDNKNLGKKQLKEWRKIIGYVSQNPYIYDGTLAENIAFGQRGKSIDKNKVIECCKKAAISDLVDSLPNGIDTMIGERGSLISGGQRQRIAIARSLYNDPQILVFDEATSSLDGINEKMILKTIYSFKKTITIILISHRKNTVSRCDNIIWLKDGKIEMIGKPDEIYNKYEQN